MRMRFELAMSKAYRIDSVGEVGDEQSRENCQSGDVAGSEVPRQREKKERK